MYDWRKMSEIERQEILTLRQKKEVPWHSPPHWKQEGEMTFIITASCYEHSPIIGKNRHRMLECESSVLQVSHSWSSKVFAWCILPNHYHLLVQTGQIKKLLGELGQFHGRSSFRWNGEDAQRGRKVWYRSTDRFIRSDDHFFATLNYVNHNAVKHGYVAKWQDWPFSSAKSFLEEIGHAKAEEIWRSYPVLGYGEKWDID
ncbi:transposase [Deltaproteobacteria bacterium TL4]